MRWNKCLGLGLALVFGGAVQAQNRPATLSQFPQTTAVPPSIVGTTGGWSVLPDGSKVMVTQYSGAPAQPVQEAAPAEPESPLGPTPPEDVGFLSFDFLKDSNIRTFGWLDAGFTTSSNGHGLIPVEPRENRFGNEFLLNQIALVIEKQLDPHDLSWGFRVEPYAGADAALLEPLGFIKVDPNSRFGFDFRQLYASAHLPILTEGGMDLKLGRMYTLIGYESAMAPYRPFYSNDYQWFYSQDGANTGFLTILHVNPQLDIYNGITLGANTFFTERGESPCYIGQVNYWTNEDKRTLLSATVLLGDQAVIGAVTGDFATVVEMRIQQNWNRYLFQVLQSDIGADQDVPGIGASQWYSFYNIFVYHLSCTWDLTNRIEWFDDLQGSRTGFATGYEEVTFGADYHPTKWLQLRPEIRWDYANELPVWRGGQDHHELTAAIDCLVKF